MSEYTNVVEIDVTESQGNLSPPLTTSPAGIRLWGLAAALAITAAFGYLYAPVIVHLVTDWANDPDAAHGFIIPLVSGYLLWTRREQLSQLQPSTELWGLVILCLGLAQLFVGHVGAELFFMRTSMLVVLTGIVWFLLGTAMLRTTAFPFAFLLFMIPLPDIILNLLAFPLQLMAAKWATFALQLLDLPVYREGNMIFLPSLSLEIVEACSGLRSLMALVALAVIWAYLSQPTVLKRVALVLSAIPIALVANAFRICTTGVLAHGVGPQAADGFYHAFAGWLVFVAAWTLLSLEGMVLSRLGTPHTQEVD
jgi:exosortase A